MNRVAYWLIVIAAVISAAVAVSAFTDARRLSREYAADIRTASRNIRFEPTYGDSQQNTRVTATFNDLIEGMIKGRELDVRHTKAVTTFRLAAGFSVFLVLYLVVLTAALRKQKNKKGA